MLLCPYLSSHLPCRYFLRTYPAVLFSRFSLTTYPAVPSSRLSHTTPGIALILFSLNVFHKRALHTSVRSTRNLTKIREIYNEIFQQPCGNNTCNFMLDLSDILYFFCFLVGFISSPVVEIPDFTTENPTISTYLYGHPF